MDKMKLHKKIHKHLIKHYHRRKHIEEDLPKWKLKILRFNHKYFNWLEYFVEHSIPWLVLMLLFIVIAEFGREINHLFEIIFRHSFHFLDRLAEIAHHYPNEIIIADKIIIGFFVIDLYFHFFKKATLKSFLRTYFLDILAILPLGFLLGVATREIGGAQSATHIIVDTERMAKSLEAEKIVAKSAEAEKLLKSVEAGKISEVVKGGTIIRIIARIPRFLRLYRLYYFFTSKKTKHINTKTKPIAERKKVKHKLKGGKDGKKRNKRKGK